MAFGAASITVLGKTNIANGLIRVRAVALGDNAYPVAGYDFNTAAILAKLGLKGWLVGSDGASFVDPVVTGINQQGLLAEFVGLKLLVSYPSGGAATSPTTVGAPTGLAASGAATASAVDATRPTVGLTPGAGKACAANTDLSGATVKFFFDAIGYPA